MHRTVLAVLRAGVGEGHLFQGKESDETDHQPPGCGVTTPLYRLRDKMYEGRTQEHPRGESHQAIQICSPSAGPIQHKQASDYSSRTCQQTEEKDLLHRTTAT